MKRQFLDLLQELRLHLSQIDTMGFRIGLAGIPGRWPSFLIAVSTSANEASGSRV